MVAVAPAPASNPWLTALGGGMFGGTGLPHVNAALLGLERTLGRRLGLRAGRI